MWINQCFHLNELRVLNYGTDSNKIKLNKIKPKPNNNKNSTFYIFEGFVNLSKCKWKKLNAATQSTWRTNSPCFFDTWIISYALCFPAYQQTPPAWLHLYPHTHEVVEWTITFSLKIASHQVSIWWQHAARQLEDWFLRQIQACSFENSKEVFKEVMPLSLGRQLPNARASPRRLDFAIVAVLLLPETVHCK